MYLLSLSEIAKKHTDRQARICHLRFYKNGNIQLLPQRRPAEYILYHKGTAQKQSLFYFFHYSLTSQSGKYVIFYPQMCKSRRHSAEVEYRLFCRPVLLGRCRLCSFLKLPSYRHTTKALRFHVILISFRRVLPSPKSFLRRILRKS